MPSDEVMHYYASGRAYTDAAVLVERGLASDDSEVRDYLMLPTHTLLGVAIETLYKAVLLHKGVSPQELKSQALRHDLKALRDRAAKEGFVSASRVGEVIDHISDNYGAHEYRYMKPGTSLNKVHVENAAVAVQSLRFEVAGEVGLA